MQEGVCYDPSTTPLPDAEGSEQFVLCCMGHTMSPGNGQLCLRYNYSVPYKIYALTNAAFTTSMAVSIWKNGNESVSFTLNNQGSLEMPGGILVHVAQVFFTRTSLSLKLTQPLHRLRQ
jgi:hypothetical protein